MDPMPSGAEPHLRRFSTKSRRSQRRIVAPRAGAEHQPLCALWLTLLLSDGPHAQRADELESELGDQPHVQRETPCRTSEPAVATDGGRQGRTRKREIQSYRFSRNPVSTTWTSPPHARRCGQASRYTMSKKSSDWRASYAQPRSEQYKNIIGRESRPLVRRKDCRGRT